MSPAQPADVVPGVTLAAIAQAAGSSVPPGADPERRIAGLAALNAAGPDELSIIRAGDPPDDIAATFAGACLVAPSCRELLPARTVALVTDDPDGALRRIAGLFFPAGFAPAPVVQREGIDPDAFVHPEARLEAGVILDPGVVVGAGAQVGSGTRIGANTIVGPKVCIGRQCRIDAHVTLCHALVGDRVIIHSGARIGLGGRAASPKLAAPELRIGRVILQDDVAIGANAVLERGVMDDTMIGEGAEIGSLAFVAADTIVPRAAYAIGLVCPAGKSR